jgi:hypothetical protein
MRHAFQLSISLIVLFISSSAAYSCSCGKPTFDEKLKISKAIFVGEIVEIKPAGNAQNAIKFRVDRHWRGVPDSYITVISDWPVLCFGLSDKVGEKYLIYAYDYKGRLETDACISPQLKEAKKELKKLGKGKVVIPPRRLTSRSTGRAISLPFIIDGSCAPVISSVRRPTGGNSE